MADSTTLELTDPVFEPNPNRGPLGRFAVSLLKDERDLPFVKLSLFLTALFLPAVVVLFWPGMFRWWMAPIYWLAYGYYLGPYILMLHNTTHRVLYKNALLNKHINWLVGPWLGLSPDTYGAHHLGIHHAEGNLPEDLSSTMGYQRDSFIDFLKYYGRFMVGYYGLTRYFMRKGRKKMLKQFWIGEGTYLIVTAAALAYDWRPALVVFVGPMLLTRFMLMAGNWGQHAFVDPVDCTNDYRTVITFINSPYNHRCFNDGYHLGHHLKGNRHWLDMPADFLAKKDEMIKQKSLVFRQLDYFMIFVLLMFKRYKTLTKYVVSLDPENPWTEDELITLFHRRLRKFQPEELEALRRGETSDFPVHDPRKTDQRQAA